MPNPADHPVGVLMLSKGLGRGGAERLLTGIARHMDPARFRVEMAYLLPWKDAFVEEIEAAGIPVHCLDGPRLADPRWLARLRRLVRTREMSLVHTHMPLPAAMARVALPGRGRTFVHTEHNLWDRYRRPTRWANALTYGRNAAAIAVSDGVAGSIRGRVAVHTVVHGIDRAALARRTEAAGAPETPGAGRATARQRLGLPGDVPVVGTVGNFTPKKDQATLLRAFAEVRAGRPDARLVMVGIGPLESALREQAADLGLDGAVLFTGMRDDVDELLGGFDLFVLSSRYEGLPIALLEAMACGVAPVVTAVGGIPEVLTHDRDGVLVRPGDDGALAAAVSGLLDDGDRRAAIGARAARRAADFDIAVAVRRIESIYESALGVASP